MKPKSAPACLVILSCVRCLAFEAQYFTSTPKQPPPSAHFTSPSYVSLNSLYRRSSTVLSMLGSPLRPVSTSPKACCVRALKSVTRRAAKISEEFTIALPRTGSIDLRHAPSMTMPCGNFFCSATRSTLIASRATLVEDGIPSSSFLSRIKCSARSSGARAEGRAAIAWSSRRFAWFFISSL